MKVKFGKVNRCGYETTVAVTIDGEYVGDLYREHFNEGSSDWSPCEDLRDYEGVTVINRDGREGRPDCCAGEWHVDWEVERDNCITVDA